MSSAAFSLLLKESLDAAPPDRVAPTDPKININALKSRNDEGSTKLIDGLGWYLRGQRRRELP
jgi:hypothetical protein